MVATQNRKGGLDAARELEPQIEATKPAPTAEELAKAALAARLAQYAPPGKTLSQRVDKDGPSCLRPVFGQGDHAPTYKGLSVKIRGAAGCYLFRPPLKADSRSFVLERGWGRGAVDFSDNGTVLVAGNTSRIIASLGGLNLEAQQGLHIAGQDRAAIALDVEAVNGGSTLIVNFPAVAVTPKADEKAGA